MKTETIKRDDRFKIFLISAKDEDRLREYVKNMIEFLERIIQEKEQEGREEQLLSDITYTSQIGRKSMEERLALVVESIDDLIGHLKKFQSNQSSDRTYRGSLKKSTSIPSGTNETNLSPFGSANADNEKDLNHLAQWWVTGSDIDWECFYAEEHKPHKISLPSYPFARKRYWITKKEGIHPPQSCG